jgi:hypothetical protein
MKRLRFKATTQTLHGNSKMLRQIMRLPRWRKAETVIRITVTWASFSDYPLRSNHEPPRGYYFANQLMKHFRFGAAKREVESLLADGAHLKTVAARDKASGRPIRFTTYKPHQIQIEGNTIVCRNNKKSVRLSSNWSIETALQKVVEALRTGKHYGYEPARDDGPTPAPSMTVRSNPDKPMLFVCPGK